MGFEHILATVGFLVLLHAAYQTIEYRTHLKLHDQEFDYPPLTVLLEVAGGFLLCLWGGLVMSGEPLPIKSAMDDLHAEQMDFRPDFINFNTRCRALPPKKVSQQ
eukprot:46969-Pyramimonas_sp.AAC.1